MTQTFPPRSDTGRVSHAAAIEKAEREYDKYNKARASLDNRYVDQLEAAVKNVKR